MKKEFKKIDPKKIALQTAAVTLCLVAVAEVITTSLGKDLAVLKQFKGSVQKAQDLMADSKDGACKELPLNVIQLQLDSLDGLSATTPDEVSFLADAAAGRAVEFNNLINNPSFNNEDLAYADEHKSPTGKNYTKGTISSGSAGSGLPTLYKVTRGSLTTYESIPDAQLANLADMSPADFRVLVKSYKWNGTVDAKSSVLAVGIGDYTDKTTGYSNLVHTEAAKKLFDDLYKADPGKPADSYETANSIIKKLNTVLGKMDSRDDKTLAADCSDSMLYATNNVLASDKAISSPDDDTPAILTDPTLQLGKIMKDTSKVPFDLASKKTTDPTKLAKQKARFTTLLSHCPLLAERMLMMLNQATKQDAFKKSVAKDDLGLTNSASPCFTDFKRYLEKRL